MDPTVSYQGQLERHDLIGRNSNIRAPDATASDARALHARWTRRGENSVSEEKERRREQITRRFQDDALRKEEKIRILDKDSRPAVLQREVHVTPNSNPSPNLSPNPNHNPNHKLKFLTLILLSSLTLSLLSSLTLSSLILSLTLILNIGLCGRRRQSSARVSL